MTIARAWILGLLFGLFAACTAQAQGWGEVRPPGGGYRVEMPTAAKFDTDDITLPDGRKAVIYQAISEYRDAAFLATYVDYPPDMIARGTPESHLNNAVNGTASGATLAGQRNIVIGGNKGRDYVVFRPDGLSMSVRNALVGNRLYQIIVVGKRGMEQNPDTKRFLESFGLIAQ